MPTKLIWNASASAPIGFYTIDAIQKRDTPLILATVLVTGAMFVVVNLIVDIVLPFLDPRIRESQV